MNECKTRRRRPIRLTAASPIAEEPTDANAPPTDPTPAPAPPQLPDEAPSPFADELRDAVHGDGHERRWLEVFHDGRFHPIDLNDPDAFQLDGRARVKSKPTADARPDDLPGQLRMF